MTSSTDEYDAYIVVSFTNATLVLSIGETVEEVTDSGFLGTAPTLACSRLGDDALIQIYPEGIRHIRVDKRVNEWKTPGKRAVARCAINERQVVIALTGGEIVYFEMDLVSCGCGLWHDIRYDSFEGVASGIVGVVTVRIQLWEHGAVETPRLPVVCRTC